MKKNIFIGFILQFISLFGYAQTATVAGILVDEKDNTPLIGAYVFLKNAFIGLVSVLMASSGGRNDNRAGAPGDLGASGTCANCHRASGPGSIELTGAPTEYEAGQTYDLTITLNQATQPIGGFQLVATNGIDNTPIGSFSTIPGETRIQSTNRLVQSTPKAFSGGSVSWTTEWTAPASGTAPENVVFYYAGNAANMDGDRDRGNDSSLWFDIVFSGSTATVLPVDLLSFEVEKTEDDYVSVVWETTNEINHDFFEVQRSTNSRDFEVVGKVNETSRVDNGINSYDFTDENLPLSEDVYYRLKQVDIDGAFAYSAVRHLRVKSDEVMTVFPNPVAVGNDISMKYESANSGERNINVFNIEGKLIFSQRNSIEKGINILNFSDVSLNRGVYCLSLEGVAKMQRVIVQ